MKRLTLVFLFIAFSFSVYSQQFWKKEDIASFRKSTQEIKERKSIPTKYEIYSVDLNSLSNYLKSSNSDFIVQLPNGDGKLERFRVQSTSNLSPNLAAKFPMIHSYSAYGIDDPTAFAKLDIGTSGFHGIIFSGKHSTVYIDPYTKDGTSNMVYYRKDHNRPLESLTCAVETEITKKAEEIPTFSMKNANDGLLRTYRIAISATGEYSQFHLNNQH